MEFTARTVTHPNAKLDRKTAMASLQKHPEFKRGTVVVGMKQDRKGRWVAQLHEPKTAADDKPPMLDDMPPMDELMPDEGEGLEDLDALDDEGEGDEDKGEKATLESLTKIVEQIAKAVGVSPKGDDAKEPMDDPLPMDEPLDGPPKPPPGPPKPPAGAPKGKAPMGVTPVGSPAFASAKTASPKVASFDVEEVWTGTIKEAREAIEAQYGAHGYKVKKIARSTREDGTPVIRARVSVR